MSYILNQYQVKFLVRDSFTTSVKSLSTINTWLSAYLSDYYTIGLSDQLLSDVNAVLNGDYPLGGEATQSMYYADIRQSETKIYKDVDAWGENPNITPDCVLPTSDFKVIAEAWRDYLAQ